MVSQAQDFIKSKSDRDLFFAHILNWYTQLTTFMLVYHNFWQFWGCMELFKFLSEVFDKILSEIGVFI